jgi:hypothetical protein
MIDVRAAWWLAVVLVGVTTAGCGGGGGGSTGGGTSNPPPPPVSTTAVTSLKVTSDFGDFVGDGKTHDYSQANASISVTATNGLLTVQVLGNEQWRGEFQMPNGYSALATGTYNNLAMYPLHDPVIGGLRWISDGRSCGGVNGSVTIRKVVYEANQLTELDLQFTQYCDGQSFALRGDFRWNAKDPTTPPGPTAPPAGLWQPASGATPASGTYVYLESQPGDYIGAGRTYLYTPTTAIISSGEGPGNVEIRVMGDLYWDGTFQGMSTLDRLKPGYYGSLRTYPVHNPAKGGLRWYGDNRGCQLEGWFVVDNITYVDSIMTSVEIRFEQRCLPSTGVLRGKIHWDSTSASQQHGPVVPVPQDLWQPAPGATPIAGNYVYFEVPTGNFVDSGKTFLYTQANSILTMRNQYPGVAVDVQGDQSWTIDFRAMMTIADLIAGYYPDLQQPPLHNPTIGGIRISGQNLLCGRGWAAVDAVQYDGNDIKSIDLRFEINCGSPTTLLRGKIHWSDSDTTVPPGPIAPPAGLWAPASGVTPAGGTYAYFESTIDPTLPTRTFLYTSENAEFFIDADAAIVLARVRQGTDYWSGELQGMNSISQLQVGYYGDLQQPFRNPTEGGMEWFGSLVGGCSESSGWFVVDGVTYNGPTLTFLEVRFEKRCKGTPTILRGKLRWSP